MASKDVLLKVDNLTTTFQTDEDSITVLDDVTFDLHHGESLGIVGESGCGKSVTALSIMRLLPKPAGQVVKGTVTYNDENLLSLSREKMHTIRGKKIAMIFQEPMTALNPVHRIGKQLGEIYQIHFPEMSEAESHAAQIDILEKVGIPSPEKRLREYPHQLSGGMRQRVMIAMALSCKPDILIADEPTTALDVTTQNQILNLMRELQQEINMSIIFITHDLGVIAEMCDRVIVMYAGRIVEQAPVKDLFSTPHHPYTKGLLESIPRLETPPKSRLEIIEGLVPNLKNIPEGCRFRSRCDFEVEDCSKTDPKGEPIGDESHRTVACIRWQELSS
jgi:oligopeptide/dipeptide ABC transporter ATP-binding protein